MTFDLFTLFEADQRLVQELGLTDGPDTRPTRDANDSAKPRTCSSQTNAKSAPLSTFSLTSLTMESCSRSRSQEVSPARTDKGKQRASLNQVHEDKRATSTGWTYSSGAKTITEASSSGSSLTYPLASDTVGTASVSQRTHPVNSDDDDLPSFEETEEAGAGSLQDDAQNAALVNASYFDGVDSEDEEEWELVIGDRNATIAQPRSLNGCLPDASLFPEAEESSVPNDDIYTTAEVEADAESRKDEASRFLEDLHSQLVNSPLPLPQEATPQQPREQELVIDQHLPDAGNTTQITQEIASQLMQDVEDFQQKPSAHQVECTRQEVKPRTGFAGIALDNEWSDGSASNSPFRPVYQAFVPAPQSHIGPQGASSAFSHLTSHVPLADFDVDMNFETTIENDVEMEAHLPCDVDMANAEHPVAPAQPLRPNPFLSAPMLGNMAQPPPLRPNPFLSASMLGNMAQPQPPPVPSSQAPPPPNPFLDALKMTQAQPPADSSLPARPRALSNPFLKTSSLDNEATAKPQETQPSLLSRLSGPAETSNSGGQGRFAMARAHLRRGRSSAVSSGAAAASESAPEPLSLPPQGKTQAVRSTSTLSNSSLNESKTDSWITSFPGFTPAAPSPPNPQVDKPGPVPAVPPAPAVPTSAPAVPTAPAVPPANPPDPPPVYTHSTPPSQSPSHSSEPEGGLDYLRRSAQSFWAAASVRATGKATSSSTVQGTTASSSFDTATRKGSHFSVSTYFTTPQGGGRHQSFWTGVSTDETAADVDLRASRRKDRVIILFGRSDAHTRRRARRSPRKLSRNGKLSRGRLAIWDLESESLRARSSVHKRRLEHAEWEGRQSRGTSTAGFSSSKRVKRVAYHVPGDGYLLQHFWLEWRGATQNHWYPDSPTGMWRTVVNPSAHGSPTQTTRYMTSPMLQRSPGYWMASPILNSPHSRARVANTSGHHATGGVMGSSWSS